MSRTLPSPRSGRKYGGTQRVAHESRAITLAARGMGLQPGTVGQLVRTREIHLQVAHLIEIAVLLKDDVLYQRLSAPVLAAIARRPVRDFSPQLMNEVQQADLTEDMAEAVFVAQRTPEARHAWLARLRQQHVLAGDLIRSLEAEERLP